VATPVCSLLGPSMHLHCQLNEAFVLNLVHLILQEKNPDVIFAKFDTSEDALEKVAEELEIQTLPSFKFFKGGKEVVDQVVGYKKKPIADAVEQLRSA